MKSIAVVPNGQIVPPDNASDPSKYKDATEHAIGEGAVDKTGGISGSGSGLIEKSDVCPCEIIIGEDHVESPESVRTIFIFSNTYVL